MTLVLFTGFVLPGTILQDMGTYRRRHDLAADQLAEAALYGRRGATRPPPAPPRPAWPTNRLWGPRPSVASTPWMTGGTERENHPYT